MPVGSCRRSRRSHISAHGEEGSRQGLILVRAISVNSQHGREIPFLSWVWGTPHTKSHTCCSSRHACVQVTSVVSRPFETPWTVAFRLLCPWDSPAGNTGVGCHALLQGIFLTQGLITSPALLGSLPVAPPGKQFSATSRKVNIVQRKPLSTALLLSALS